MTPMQDFMLSMLFFGMAGYVISLVLSLVIDILELTHLKKKKKL